MPASLPRHPTPDGIPFDRLVWLQQMKALNQKALGELFFLLLSMAGLLFLPAWTVDYWQAWVFLAVFAACSLAITLYLIKKDPKLLERRVYAGPTAEKEPAQKIIQSITSLGFIAMLVVPSLDYRYHWSEVAFSLTIAGDVLVAIGFFIAFLVSKENTFAAATIQVAPDQQVISTGLYGWVRHPMYMGALLLFVGMCLSLGSWWDLLVLLLVFPALLWRIFDEEKLLATKLPGYTEYCQKVRYRLLPFIW